MTLKHIKFDEEDLKAVEQVQRLYGCENFSQAVRLAARIAANQARNRVVPPPLSKHVAPRTPRSLWGIIKLPPGADPDEFDKALHAVAQKAVRGTEEEWTLFLDEKQEKTGEQS